MSMDKPFRVEVGVAAPQDEVWRTVTEPEHIRQWFGWDYDGLEDEIEHIFVDDAQLSPPSRIGLGDDGWIELEAAGPGRTIIRAVKPGAADGWDGVYGPIEEGWVTFLNQLRHRLERHPGSRRRTIYLRAPSFPELAIVFGEPGADAGLVVTTYDLDDAAFAAAERRWQAWSGQVA
jgi:hypothetical protein